MAVTINASTSNGLVQTADTSGQLQLQTAGTTAVTLDTSQNATFVGYANMPNTFGFKNRIINGAMVIDQRNAGASQTIVAATPTYSLDRWTIYSTGSNVASQQVSSGITGLPNVLQITGAASNTTVQVWQRIESKNIADLAGSTVTISALLSNSLLTSIAWYAYYANATDNWSGNTLISNGTFTVNSTLSSYSTQISLPANASNGVMIVFIASNQTSGTFKISNVQLEKGSTATSFDYRPYGTELQLCQRYYYKVKPGATNLFISAIGQCFATNNFGSGIPFPVTMRATPTALDQTGTPSDYKVLNAGGTGINLSSGPTLDVATSNNLGYINGFVTSGLTGGNAAILAVGTSGVAYLGFNAEL